jgi:hypothetical protein
MFLESASVLQIAFEVALEQNLVKAILHKSHGGRALG